MPVSYLPFQNPDTTDEKLDTYKALVGADYVHRERIQIAGVEENEIAKVRYNTPAISDYGVVTRPIFPSPQDVDGDVAHDSADSGKPIKVGGYAVVHGVAPPTVNPWDRVQCIANRDGVPFQISGHPNTERIVAEYNVAVTRQTIKTVAAGNIFIITEAAVFLGGNAISGAQAKLEFGNNTYVLITEHPYIAPGSGFVEGNGGGILAIGGNGLNLRFTCEYPQGGKMKAHVSGFSIPS